MWDSRLPPLPLRISDCGDTLWPNLDLHLSSGWPLSEAAGPSAFYSLCRLFSVLLFLLFSPHHRLGFAAGEADSFAPGEALYQALYQAGRNVVSSRRKSMVWGMALTSQSQLSSCVSGHRKSALSQRASFNSEMTGGSSAWGRRERACHGQTGSARGAEEAVDTGPGSGVSGSVFGLFPGAEGRR